MERLLCLAETIDQLMISDIRGRGLIGKLYRYARSVQGEPLALRAAKKLTDAVKSGSVVLIATGAACRPPISPEIGEIDGPTGAVALGRSLEKAFNTVPVFLCEPQLLTPMKACVVAGGFYTEVSIEKAIENSTTYMERVKVAPVASFPIEKDEAKRAAKSLLNKYPVTAVVVVEKGGMNKMGVIHNSRGFDRTPYISKIDYLIREAKNQGIVTIGIGDGGNEVGMGLIAEGIRKELRYGSKCQCPCNGGIVPEEATDVLVTSSVSNWGGHAITAALALLHKNIDIVHKASVETRMLMACSLAGLIDAGSGYTDPAADGITDQGHSSFLNLLLEVVQSYLETPYGVVERSE